MSAPVAELVQGGIKMPIFETREEQNADLLARGLKGYDGKLSCSFRVNPYVFFEVRYGELDYLSQDPYFSTAAELYDPKIGDLDTCGQAQKTLLEKGTPVWDFYEKWDPNHIQVMTIEAYDEMTQDLERLKAAYPYVVNGSTYDMVALEKTLQKKEQ